MPNDTIATSINEVFYRTYRRNSYFYPTFLIDSLQEAVTEKHKIKVNPQKLMEVLESKGIQIKQKLFSDSYIITLPVTCEISMLDLYNFKLKSLDFDSKLTKLKLVLFDTLHELRRSK